MTRYKDNTFLFGTYTLAFSGTKGFLIGDNDRVFAEFNGMEDLMESLIDEKFTGICRRDGVIKVEFNKDLSEYGIEE